MGKKRIAVIDLAADEEVVIKSAKTKVSRVHSSHSQAETKSHKAKRVEEGGAARPARIAPYIPGQETKPPQPSTSDQTTLAKPTAQPKKSKPSKKTPPAKGAKIITSGKGGGGRLSDQSAEAEAELARQQEIEAQLQAEITTTTNTTTRRKRRRSKRYQAAKIQIDRTKNYTPDEAVKLVRTINLAKFDATVELHLNTTKRPISGEVTLPHSTGKKLTVRIVDDQLYPELDAGRLDFDILIASPQDMPKLARYAKILGPKGLMPNPKNGTIAADPQKRAQELKNGAIAYKTEPKSPIIHLTIGKLSLTDQQLTDNLNTFLHSIKPALVRSAYLTSTMSPSVPLALPR